MPWVWLRLPSSLGTLRLKYSIKHCLAVNSYSGEAHNVLLDSQELWMKTTVITEAVSVCGSALVKFSTGPLY